MKQLQQLILGIFLANLAMVVWGGLLEWTWPQFRYTSLALTAGILSITALGVLLEQVIAWLRRQFPTRLPGPGMETRPISPPTDSILEPVMAAVAAGAPVASIQSEPLVVRYKLADTLHQMVTNHYDKRAISRTSMVATGQAQANYWQLAQAVLVHLGIRDSKEHSVWNGQGDSKRDIRYITQRLRVEDDEVWVRPADVWVNVDLKVCHFL